jgi:hypothetical protein
MFLLQHALACNQEFYEQSKSPSVVSQSVPAKRLPRGSRKPPNSNVPVLNRQIFPSLWERRNNNSDDHVSAEELGRRFAGCYSDCELSTIVPVKGLLTCLPAIPLQYAVGSELNLDVSLVTYAYILRNLLRMDFLIEVLLGLLQAHRSPSAHTYNLLTALCDPDRYILFIYLFLIIHLFVLQIKYIDLSFY